MGILTGRCEQGIHRFEPRYDKSEVLVPWDRIENISIPSGDVDALRRITYVRDVCVRCGKTVERA